MCLSPPSVRNVGTAMAQPRPCGRRHDDPGGHGDGHRAAATTATARLGKPQVVRLEKATMSGGKAGDSLYWEARQILTVKVCYASDSDSDCKEVSEELTATHLARGAWRDVWTGSSERLGAIVLKLTVQLADQQSVNAREVEIYTELREQCAAIYFNQEDVEIMDSVQGSTMTNSTKSKRKDGTKFQLMLQEKMDLTLQQYIQTIPQMYPVPEDGDDRSDADRRAAIARRVEMILVTGWLLQKVMDLCIAVAGRKYLLHDGHGGNLGVGLGTDGRVARLVVIDVEACDSRKCDSVSTRNAAMNKVKKHIATSCQMILETRDRVARHPDKIFPSEYYVWPSEGWISDRWTEASMTKGADATGGRDDAGTPQPDDESEMQAILRRRAREARTAGDARGGRDYAGTPQPDDETQRRAAYAEARAADDVSDAGIVSHRMSHILGATLQMFSKKCEHPRSDTAGEARGEDDAGKPLHAEKRRMPSDDAETQQTDDEMQRPAAHDEPPRELPEDMRSMVRLIFEEHRRSPRRGREPKTNGGHISVEERRLGHAECHENTLPSWFIDQIYAMLSFLWVALRDARHVYWTLTEAEQRPAEKRRRTGGTATIAAEKQCATPKVLIAAETQCDDTGHRWFVKKLVPRTKFLVKTAYAEPNERYGQPSETRHLLMSVMEGALGSILDHVCMWDACGSFLDNLPCDGVRDGKPPGWNHRWAWMAILDRRWVKSGLYVSASRLTDEAKAAAIDETVAAMIAYLNMRDKALIEGRWRPDLEAEEGHAREGGSPQPGEAEEGHAREGGEAVGGRAREGRDRRRGGSPQPAWSQHGWSQHGRHGWSQHGWSQHGWSQHGRDRRRLESARVAREQPERRDGWSQHGRTLAP